jgi:hypothetical protein
MSFLRATDHQNDGSSVTYAPAQTTDPCLFSITQPSVLKEPQERTRMPMWSNEEWNVICGAVDRGRGPVSVRQRSSQQHRQQQHADRDPPRMVLCPVPEGAKG